MLYSYLSPARSARIITAAVCTLVWLHFSPVSAEPRTYQIDSARSSLTLSGVFIGAYPIQAQGPGTLTTGYEGEITVEDTIRSVEILDASLQALNSGTYVPAVGGGFGVAEGNYGVTLDLALWGIGQQAFREVAFDLQSAPAAVDWNGRFSTAELGVGLLNAYVDSNLGILGQFRDNFGGLMTLNKALPATRAVRDEIVTLTIPIDATFHTGLGTTFQFEGRVVATRPLEPGEPLSLLRVAPRKFRLLNPNRFNLFQK